MKKLTTSLLFCCIAILVILGLMSCGNECEHIYDGCDDTECNECGETRSSMHAWTDADCISPKTCTVCNETEGNALGHEWTTPDIDLCKIQSTCSRCGATDGENAEHTWTEASCEKAKSCTVCGATDGDPIGHTPNADDGNCSTAITCQICAAEMTSAKAHDFTGEWERDSDGHWHECRNDDCSVTDKKSEHTPSDEDNNCETSVKCTVCDEMIVEAKAHDFTGEWERDSEGHWHECTNDGCAITDAKTSHSGGVATCLQGAICTDCITEYTEKDANNHESDEYTYESNGETTHKKIHECNAVTDEETHIINTSEEITYTWSNDYASCTAKGICSLCEASVTEATSSTDGEKSVSAEFTITGFKKQYFYKTTISFNTDGGSNIAPIIQLLGTKVTPPANPTKPGFIFTGWNKEIPTTMPSENVIITATWVAATYTVIWKDENGTVLERDEGLLYGETPTYNGEKPYKAATEEYSYLFSGWTPSVGTVTGDKTYTAVYEAIKIEVLEGCTYKKGDVVNCKSSTINYCAGCGKLLTSYTATITGLRGIQDGKPIYWITYHCCGRKTSVIETAIVGKK